MLGPLLKNDCCWGFAYFAVCCFADFAGCCFVISAVCLFLRIQFRGVICGSLAEQF
jgi:hypothetical protein